MATSRERTQRLIRSLAIVACVGLGSGSLTTNVQAQEMARSPIFLLQPGMVTTDFVSSKATTASTGFNARFATLLPTKRSWLTPVLGVNITPYGATGFTTIQTNAPSVFVGNVFPVVPDSVLGGWLRMDVPVLWYYTYGGGGEHNSRLFGRDFYLELALTSSLGKKLLGGLGPNWKRLEAYLLFDQNLTPNPDPVSSRTDRFNPIALFGITLRLGNVR